MILRFLTSTVTLKLEEKRFINEANGIMILVTGKMSL
jgi:hypothetical protein